MAYTSRYGEVNETMTEYALQEDFAFWLGLNTQDIALKWLLLGAHLRESC